LSDMASNHIAINDGTPCSLAYVLLPFIDTTKDLQLLRLIELTISI
jgi:hypothetical protein